MGKYVRIHSTAVQAIGSVITTGIRSLPEIYVDAQNAAPLYSATTAANKIIGRTASSIRTSAKVFSVMTTQYNEPI
jgi:hypothetical protein